MVVDPCSDRQLSRRTTGQRAEFMNTFKIQLEKSECCTGNIGLVFNDHIRPMCLSRDEAKDLIIDLAKFILTMDD